MDLEMGELAPFYTSNPFLELASRFHYFSYIKLKTQVRLREKKIAPPLDIKSFVYCRKIPMIPSFTRSKRRVSTSTTRIFARSTSATFGLPRMVQEKIIFNLKLGTFYPSLPAYRMFL